MTNISIFIINSKEKKKIKIKIKRMRFVLGIFAKVLGVVGFSALLIPFILFAAFMVLKVNLTMKNVLAGKDSFFYNNVGDLSWFFNLLVDILIMKKLIIFLGRRTIIG